MRFGEILLAYFMCGALLWGGGVIGWDEIGVADQIVDEPGDGSVGTEDGLEDDLTGIGGAIASLVNTVAGGALLAIWGIITGFMLIFWPVSVLIAVNAPAPITVVLGGAMSLIFVIGVLRIVRGSA